MAHIPTDSTIKDFDSMLQALIDFATDQFGEHTSANRVWSDFNVSSFSRNWAELVSYVSDNLMFYLDAQSNQAYLNTATIPSFVLRIAQQFGYEVPTAQSASGKVTFTTSGPYSILRGTRVGSALAEFYIIRDISGNVAEDVEVEAIQGKEYSTAFAAGGIQNESIVLPELEVVVDIENVISNLRSPLVRVNGEFYDIVNTPLLAAPNDRIAVKSFDTDGRLRLTFGDGVFGRRLNPNDSVSVSYRVGGGTVGNIEQGEITTMLDAVSNVSTVTNNTKFSGGLDTLSIEEVKVRTIKSLQTLAGAVSLPDYGDILQANFPQILRANAEINKLDAAIDLDVYVVPQGNTLSNITDNQLLSSNLSSFLENKKTVTTQFVIADANAVHFAITVEIFLDRDAPRSVVEADVKESLRNFFDLNTGNVDEAGMSFQEVVKVGDVFDAIKDIEGIARFEIQKFTIIPRVEQIVTSPRAQFYVSEVDVYRNVGINEWIVVATDIANPDPVDGQVEYTVHKRTLATVTSVTEDSIADSDLDFTLVQGVGVTIANTTVTDSKNVFQPSQYNGQLLVDRDNNIWEINQTKSRSIVVKSPSLNDASVIEVANGDYRIVKSFSGEKVAVSGVSFTILYNTRNTFFSSNAQFNLIATPRTEFFLDEEQSTKGTFGVPVSISDVTSQGSNPGDLVTVKFNGNPNFTTVDDDYILVDKSEEVFEVVNVDSDDQPVAEYFDIVDLDSEVELTDTGADQSIDMPIKAERDTDTALITVQVYLKRIDNPSGNILADLYTDLNGKPDTLIQTSNPLDVALIGTGFSSLGFVFGSGVSFIEGQDYHVVVKGDNAYRVSYAALDGAVQVGLDTTQLGYLPAQTAAGNITIKNNSNISILAKSSTKLRVVDNNIRKMVLAKGTLRITNNDFSGGTHSIDINGVVLEEVVDWVVGGTIQNTRDSIKAAIDASLAGVVTTASVDTDTIEYTAVVTDYSGELGNLITTSVIDPGATSNFSLSGGTLQGGVNGDKVIITAPEYYNSGLIPYNYDSTTGIVQYAAPSGLPVFVSGDRFVDGVGTIIDVLGIDVGNNQVLLAIGLAVDNTVDSIRSGAVERDYSFEFETDVSIGGDVDATAENLRVVLNAAVSAITTSRVNNELTVESIEEGSVGNLIKITFDDIGTPNFEVDSELLEGGDDSDVIKVDGVNLTAVVSGFIAGTNFIKGANASDTAASLASSVSAIPTTVGNSTNEVVNVSASSQGEVGNNITLEVSESTQGTFELSGSNLEGGQDNRRALTYNGSIWSDYTPEADILFKVGISSDGLTIVSKADESGNQIIPEVSANAEIDSSVAKRYYSDSEEVSFIIATRTPNAFIIGAPDADLYARGTVQQVTGVRLDHFIFRTSKFTDDVTDLRGSEIPVLREEDVKLPLIGGVS